METMEVSFTPLLVSLIFTVLFSVYYLLPLLRSRKDKVQSPKTPPGRIGLQFIGETRDFVSCGLKGTPESFIFDRVKKYGSNTVKTSLFGEQMAILCGPEANKFLFSNENKLVRNWWPRSFNLLFGTPDQSGESDIRNVRRILSHLTADALQKYVPTIDYEVKVHLQNHWEGRDVVTVLPLMQLYAITTICRLTLGISDEPTIVKLNKMFFELRAGALCLPVNIPGTSFYRCVKMKAELRKYLKELIKKIQIDIKEERSSASGSILTDLLKESSDHEGLPDKLLSMIVAALDTTSDTLTSLLMFLAKLPHVYDKVMAEQREIARSKGPEEALNWRDLNKMKYSWNVACEMLRIHPPRVIFREVISDFTYDGFLIPKGWKICFSPMYTHINSVYYKDPKKFDPSRFEGDGPAPFSYIPFGGGPRMCPGREFTRVQILVFLHNVVTKFKWEQTNPDGKMMLQSMLVPADGLPIRLHPHK